MSLPVSRTDWLLLRIAAGTATDEDLRAIDGISAEILAERAVAFRLAARVRTRLRAAKVEWPERAMRLLDEELRSASKDWLVQQSVLADVAGKLDSSGYAFVVLKGAALALAQYADPLLRQMRDIDLLFARDDARKAYELLLSEGYKPVRGAIPLATQFSHQYPALVGPQGVLVEVHHGLITDWTEGAALGARMLRSERMVRCLDRDLRIPHSRDLALHAIAHATLNRPFDNGPQLLADLDALGMRDPQLFEGTREAACALGLSRAAGLIGDMISALDATEPAGESDTRIVDAFRLIMADEQAERQRKLLLRLGGTRPAAAQVLTKLLRPTPAALGDLAGRTADDPLRWLAYPRWVFDRAAQVRQARHSPELREEVDLSSRLSQWLRG